jgi:hypothetical protein
MDYVALKFNISPLNLRLYRDGSYKPELSNLTYGMSLQEA